MGRLLRVLAPGLGAVGCAVAAYSLWWLWADVSRNKLERPTPIDHRRYPVWIGPQ